MAQIDNTATMRTGKSFASQKKQMLRIDMTPMVDLGFLLIAFFGFTTSISKPTATELLIPNDDNIHSMPLPESLALTLLLDDRNKIYYYEGDFNDAIKTNRIFQTDFSVYNGIGVVIRQKQKELEESGKFSIGKRGLMLVIKPTSKANYKNVVDALDEIMINNVSRYAIVEPSNEEIGHIGKMDRGF